MITLINEYNNAAATILNVGDKLQDRIRIK